jgi:hypothetical protein
MNSKSRLMNFKKPMLAIAVIMFTLYPLSSQASCSSIFSSSNIGASEFSFRRAKRIAQIPRLEYANGLSPKLSIRNLLPKGTPLAPLIDEHGNILLFRVISEAPHFRASSGESSYSVSPAVVYSEVLGQELPELRQIFNQGPFDRHILIAVQNVDKNYLVPKANASDLNRTSLPTCRIQSLLNL